MRTTFTPRVFYTLILFHLMSPLRSKIQDVFRKIVWSTDGQHFHVYDYYNPDVQCSIPDKEVFMVSTPEGLFGEIISNNLFVCQTYMFRYYICSTYEKKNGNRWRLRKSLGLQDFNSTKYVTYCVDSILANGLAFIRRDKSSGKLLFYVDLRHSLSFITHIEEEPHLSISEMHLIPGISGQCIGVYDHTESFWHLQFPAYPLHLHEWNYEVLNVKPMGNHSWTIFTGKGARFFMNSVAEYMIFLEVEERGAPFPKENSTFVILKPKQMDFQGRHIYHANVDLSVSSELINLKKTFGVLLPTREKNWVFYIFNGAKLIFERTPLSLAYKLPQQGHGEVLLGVPDFLLDCPGEANPQTHSAMRTLFQDQSQTTDSLTIYDSTKNATNGIVAHSTPRSSYKALLLANLFFFCLLVFPMNHDDICMHVYYICHH